MTGTLNMEVIDELMALSEDGDPELLVDLIEMYLADSPGKIEAITRGTSAGDWEAVERAAHSLKGSAGNLGAVEVQSLCDRVQNACRSKETTDVPEMVRALQEHARAAETALRELLDRLR
ncbi:MAG TPA: Hpt domain-containing protein [Planctomycetota bacterium]|nr:Hpt domain-containing protein [Planctomycetota bacterium]